MPILLDRMPFLAQPGEVIAKGQRVRVRANQIIVWVSLTLRRVTSANPVAAPFPAILDTGLTRLLAELHHRPKQPGRGRRSKTEE